MNGTFELFRSDVQRNIDGHIGQFKILFELMQQFVIELLLLDRFQQLQTVCKVG